MERICALPIIGIVGGTGFLALIAMHAEKIALVLLVVAGGLFALSLYKKKQAPPIPLIALANQKTRSQNLLI